MVEDLDAAAHSASAFGAHAGKIKYEVVFGHVRDGTTVTGDNRVVIKINHATKADGAYPIVMVSYDVVCPAYKDAKQAEFAKAWLTYVTSDEGQKAAQDAAGTAPLPASLKTKVAKSIEAIKTK